VNTYIVKLYVSGIGNIEVQIRAHSENDAANAAMRQYGMRTHNGVRKVG